MSKSTEKRPAFWKELKRRGVPRVMAMYAATAFIIMEAGDIIEIPQESQERSRRKMRLSDFIIAVLLLVVPVLAYPKIFNQGRSNIPGNMRGKISIAVMPFKNVTGDSTYTPWQEGMQNLMITSLSNSAELSVRQFETMNSLIRDKAGINYASLTPSLAGDLAHKVDANTVICGNMHKSSQKLREIHPYSAYIVYMLAWIHFNMDQWEISIDGFERNIRMLKKMDAHPWAWTYILLGGAYHNTGAHKEEQKTFNEGRALWPEQKSTFDYWQAICALSRGDSTNSVLYLEEIRKMTEQPDWPEALL